MVTKADVQRLYAEELARGKSSRDARQGTRTTVQALMQVDRPTPAGPVTDADRLASEKARESVDGNHKDALHFVQKTHQKALWVAADKLVVSALGSAT
jgi:hypothetical protein